MLKNTNLDEMSKEELLALKEEIDHRLKDAGFWETITVIDAIDKQEGILRVKRGKIEHSCEQLKKLKELGFTLVIFSVPEKRIGFINYNIPKIDDKFYGFDVRVDEILNKSTYQTLSDNDMIAASIIFEKEVLQS